MNPNYKEPKFNAPHRVSPQQRIELEGQINKLLKANSKTSNLKICRSGLFS